ncbi:vacuolar protein sorting-associated protein 33B-like [Hippopotamus amphibius kiboko]|uniref:vacuolar protein sorting-associated protein 33B-like n=1 Tax=Hippopotamus amphibius kiboko TaxID=575201 RepID=UPI0025961652|nr:vacuolar protein sorting-associated protein 33B-like [Hippopotamus amphibius kiboko]XP_057575941.1 vacuolar protein sorting-associated protein 33B-like [Hippopotamus amphibius kiboko]XP_057575942.1 vacuolar protein sorting-associated protein 33B-like [Hippopotamus amphibius kiboko]XP_057575943.1 vacuolar protein sorting-associated protein 33B-like [Hippopotamus amphibius kiboko]
MALRHRPDAPELPDFSMLKRLARDQLLYLLEQRPGKKDLFIEADLMSPLDRIANVSILKIVLLGQTSHQEYAVDNEGGVKEWREYGDMCIKTYD